MEKKPNTIKQTAAKIKTKIHNTSSFFKLSLKTNNKALALALVAQKEKSKQLEMETARLQKDLQNLRFDLAIQRHKNTKMFRVLREFYNNSLNCMAKAVDLISKEEGAESADTEIPDESSQTEKDATALLPGQKTRTSLYKSGQQKNTESPGGKVSMLNDDQPHSSSPQSKEKPHSPKVDNTAPQNALYESEMELTVVDNVAEIVTVQTKGKKSCKIDQRKTSKNSDPCSARSRKSIVLNYDQEAVESSCPKSTTVNTSMQTSCETDLQTNTHNKSEEESLPQHVELLHEEEESVTAQRKTHVTSRYTKSNRRLDSQKLFAGYTNKKQIYVIPPHESSFISASNDLEDYFSDQGVQSQRRSKESLYDSMSKDKDIESEAEMLKPQNNSENSRKTYVIPHSLRPQDRRTKVSSFSIDLRVKESSKCIDFHNDVQEICSEKRQSMQSTQSLSRTGECNTLRNRGTYVIHTGQISECNDLPIHTLDTHTHVTSRETANEISLESTKTAHCSSAMQSDQEVSHLPENRRAVCDENVFDNLFDHSPIGHTKAKKPKTAVPKERKKNFTTKENASTKKRHKYSFTQTGDILPKEIPLPGDNKKKNSTSTNLFQEVTESLNSSAHEEAFMDEPATETGDTNSTHLGHFDHNDDLDTINDIDINLKDASQKHHNNQNAKSKCRDTYVVLSNCNSQLNGKENVPVMSSNEEGLIADRTFVPHHDSDSQSTPIRAEHLRQKHSGLFSEDRPPWESLDYGSTESFMSDSPVTIQKNTQEISSETMNIYEEPEWNMSHLSPDGRAMKSLTNTDLTANPLGRSRRKAAPVSYKEPPLNCKMRRGDKFSDTKFLHSPVYKDKKKKSLRKMQMCTFGNKCPSDPVLIVLLVMCNMETRQVKRSIEALLGHYIGQKIRENDFDPTGKGSSSMLDNLAHYDLAINVALWYLNEKKGADMNELIGAISPSHNNCSNRLEREAIILSSFAGMILNSLPVTDILSLYSCKPSVSCPYPDTNSNIIHPFSLSYHPFAMLSSFKAVDRSRKHTQMLKRWKTLRNKRASAQQEKQMVSSPTPSSPSSFSDSVDSLKEQTKHYEGSEESQQD